MLTKFFNNSLLFTPTDLCNPTVIISAIWFHKLRSLVLGTPRSDPKYGLSSRDLVIRLTVIDTVWVESSGVNPSESVRHSLFNAHRTTQTRCNFDCQQLFDAN